MLPKHKLATVFVTKYALTEGIFKATGEIILSGYRALSYTDGSRPYFHKGRLFVGVGKDCALTEAEALAQAEKKRAAAIKSCEKKLAKLKSIVFMIKEKR